MTPHEVVRRVTTFTEVGDSSKQIVAELNLTKEAESHILFELQCLQIIAVEFSIIELFRNYPGLLEAYSDYWTTYSAAVSVGYAEEANNRLPRYRDAFSSEADPAYSVGKAFVEISGGDHPSLSSLASNVFARTFGQASNLLNTLQVDTS